MLEADRIRVSHMVDAIESARKFVQGRHRADLDNDEMLLFALVRAVEILGEAASKVTPEGRERCPEVPWGLIVGMRNRLAHAYFDIDPNIVWDTATLALPALLPLLQRVFEEKE